MQHERPGVRGAASSPQCPVRAQAGTRTTRAGPGHCRSVPGCRPAVPEQPAQRNVYQLTQRQGLPWSPGVDAHIQRRGGELLGGSEFVALDCDTQLAVDGSVWIDGFRWLADAGAAMGQVLDLGAFLPVRTPGDPDRGHGPGWHLWCRADPDSPVRHGPLKRCTAVEIKNRCTCPGSPGYEIRPAPVELPVLPRWIAELAGPPPAPVAAAAGRRSGGSAWGRMHGVLGRLLAAEPGERNRLLFWASARAGELVAAGDLEASAAEKALKEAAADIGLTRDDGEQAVVATVRSGFERAGVTYAAR